ncbi:hypothetical protein BT96DRAFT_938976 [Gymnopus androsaceus JB14]|uniref:Uncharacterized protein n=1 Tax=Gymnopus androsaceus JB14 TaxID=1447944 RepID=A0A6A4HNR1_9AGAR|nr:hypothetical protein BT96DRAFT_938976 [Gymnopus androsaceus JB14]
MDYCDLSSDQEYLPPIPGTDEIKHKLEASAESLESLDKNPKTLWKNNQLLVAEKIEAMKAEDPPNISSMFLYPKFRLSNVLFRDPDHKCSQYYYARLHGENTWEAKKTAIQCERECHKLKHCMGELEWDKKVLENENKHLKDKLAKHEEESSWFIWMVKSGVNKLGIALLEDKNLEDAQDAGEELAQALEVIGEYTIA